MSAPAVVGLANSQLLKPWETFSVSARSIIVAGLLATIWPAVLSLVVAFDGRGRGPSFSRPGGKATADSLPRDEDLLPSEQPQCQERHDDVHGEESPCESEDADRAQGDDPEQPAQGTVPDYSEGARPSCVNMDSWSK